MSSTETRELQRSLGLWGLVATGVSTMVGGAINVMPLMLHRTTPTIGPNVPLAYLLAAVPAVFAALAYARLSAAMPRVGGSYVYLSRVLHPGVGFVASFCQWFGLSIITGVVAYLVVPFVRDFVAVLDPSLAARLFASEWVVLGVPIVVLWLFAGINMLGTRTYTLTLVPLMLVMLACSSIVIVAGFTHEPAQFLQAAGMAPEALTTVAGSMDVKALVAAAAILFGSFIGFEAIALAGGEAKNPQHTLPAAILIAMLSVTVFYLAFCAAVYHVVPWQYARLEASGRDITVPGMMSFILSKPWAALVAAGAGLALVNHLPPMLLAVSRMLVAWSDDGILPAAYGRLHPIRGTPDCAIVTSAGVATSSVIACHYAGDFLLGVDVLTTTMLINFALVCLALLLLLGDRRRAQQLGLVSVRRWEGILPAAGLLLLLGLLVFHVHKDLTASVTAWYFRSTWLLLAVLSCAIAIYRFRRPASPDSVRDAQAYR